MNKRCKQGEPELELLNPNCIKHSFTTYLIPLDRMAGVTPFLKPPCMGDLMLAEVLHLGRNTTLEGRHGQQLSQCDFALRPSGVLRKQGEVLVVVGASMNAGKTTTIGMLVRVLRLAGKRVAAAKITGTAASKDQRFFEGCGADLALD